MTTKFESKLLVYDKTAGGYGKEGLCFGNRLFSFAKEPHGMVIVQEECDAYFNVKVSKKDLVEALKEAITWLETDP